jgi:hypothetical protein
MKWPRYFTVPPVDGFVEVPSTYGSAGFWIDGRPTAAERREQLGQAARLGNSVLVMRDCTERPEAVDAGT